MVCWNVIIYFCTSHDKHILHCSNNYNENDVNVSPGFVNSPMTSTQVYILEANSHEIHSWNMVIQTVHLRLTFFYCMKTNVPQNSALCRFHTIKTIWNYLQHPPPTVCRWIKKFVGPSQNAKNYYRSMNDDLHKYTCANLSTGVPTPGFQYDIMYPRPNLDQVCYKRYPQKNPTTTSSCFWILHSSSNSSLRTFGLSECLLCHSIPRLLQSWNKAYVTRHVLGNKHATTSFRCLTTYKLAHRKNTTLPTVFLHIIAFHCITSLTAHGDT